MDYKALDKQYVMNTYARNDLVLNSGKGSTSYDLEGNSYIDFTSGIGVNSLGFCNEKWVEAVCKQANTMQHISNLYYTTPNIELAAKLCQKTGYKRVFFGNSGAEANEGAIKIAREYARVKYNGERDTILTLVNSFHGRTVTTLAATGQKVFHEKFLPLTTGFDYITANDIEDLKAKVNEHTAAIMIEIVQGEGGVIALNQDFVTAIDQICKEKDIVFVVDEVQTGVGRTGTFLACEQFGVKPDVVSLAKGLGGGLPIGAVLVDDKLDILTYGDHGSTFGGNPISCAGANVVIDALTPEFLDEVKQKGIKIREYLKDCSEINSITGLGMMVGIELKTKKAADVKNECMANGLLVLTAKTKVRLLPPLNISDEELEKGLEILKKVLEK